jgi:CO/xanthine dehydrogenase Mo-binding subunit
MAYSLIGKDYTPPDIRAKVTGTAKYAEDFKVDGMVFCRLFTSPIPHARVLSIDTSEALQIPGVVGILTADDVPRLPGVERQILTLHGGPAHEFATRRRQCPRGWQRAQRVPGGRQHRQ